MTHTVEVTKDNYYGNIADTSVSLGPVEVIELGERLAGERILRVRTSRDRGRRIISSFASVFVLVDSGRGYRTQIMAIGGDFTSRLGTVSTKAATAKEIARVHEVALLELSAVVESANSFYSARERRHEDSNSCKSREHLYTAIRNKTGRYYGVQNREEMVAQARRYSGFHEPA